MTPARITPRITARAQTQITATRPNRLYVAAAVPAQHAASRLQPRRPRGSSCLLLTCFASCLTSFLDLARNLRAATIGSGRQEQQPVHCTDAQGIRQYIPCF
jgi:hypothetical protein